MTSSISPFTLKSWLHDGGEIALLDVRERGQFGESHLFYAVPLPYSHLERDVTRLVPKYGVRTVICDDGEEDSALAQRAAARLNAIGYRNVSVLAGGTRGGETAGLALFAGENLPSKTFGELAERTYHTPRISAAELNGRLQRHEPVVVLDARPFFEFQKMSIPTATCCPNGEWRIESANWCRTSTLRSSSIAQAAPAASLAPKHSSTLDCPTRSTRLKTEYKAGIWPIRCWSMAQRAAIPSAPANRACAPLPRRSLPALACRWLTLPEFARGRPTQAERFSCATFARLRSLQRIAYPERNTPRGPADPGNGSVCGRARRPHCPV